MSKFGGFGQRGEIPLAHVLLLALVTIPVVIGMIYFLTASEAKLQDGGNDLKTEKTALDRKVKDLKDAFK